jgi:acyl carrier protein
MSDATYDKVKDILVKQLKIDAEKVAPTARFAEELIDDSLGMVELLSAMEDEFGMTISDEDAEKLVTVQDAVEYIESNA